MKRKVFGIFAITLAIVFSSFTVKTSADYYLVYNQTLTGPEHCLSSYDFPVFSMPMHIAGAGRINWIKVADLDNDYYIDDMEFIWAFNVYNQTDPSSSLLSDETDRMGELDVMEY